MPFNSIGKSGLRSNSEAFALLTIAAVTGPKLGEACTSASSPAANPVGLDAGLTDGVAEGLGLGLGLGDGVGLIVGLGVAVGLAIGTDISVAPVNNVSVFADSVLIGGDNS